MKKEEETKEEFCGACVAVPLALLGAGAATASSSSGYKLRKTILLWGGIGLGVIALIIFIYFKFIKKCSTCR